MQVQVSVIIPVYNAEKYLKECLDSVINQSLNDIEIICVDDGSTDQSFEILEEYKKKDSRIVLYKQTEKSEGAALARNFGLKHARGEYVAILDADDIFEYCMLEHAYNKAIVDDADIVEFDAFFYYDSDNRDVFFPYIAKRRFIPKSNIFSPEEVDKNLFMITWGSAWNLLFKNELIKKNKLMFHSVHFSDDLGFVYSAIACASKISFLPERLIHYRKLSNDNQSSKVGKWPETGYKAYYYLKNELEKQGYFDKYKYHYLERAFGYALLYLRMMPDIESANILYQALKGEYLEKMGFLSFDKKGEAWEEQCEAFLSTNDYYEFLFWNSRNRIKKNSFSLPYKEDRCEKVRIILYGAGELGQTVFKYLMDEKNIEIISWVDQTYEKYGFPVENPNIINDKKFDYVYVAVEQKKTVNAIIKWLINKNINEKKIVSLLY